MTRPVVLGWTARIFLSILLKFYDPCYFDALFPFCILLSAGYCISLLAIVSFGGSRKSG